MPEHSLEHDPSGVSCRISGFETVSLVGLKLSTLAGPTDCPISGILLAVVWLMGPEVSSLCVCWKNFSD